MSWIGWRLYLPATILIIVTALVGFWPTYFGPALKGTVNVPPLIHLHAVIFVTWLALFATQVTLAATSRVKLHMQLGRWIMAYGGIVVIAGLMAAAQGFGTRLATGDVRGPNQLWSFCAATCSARWSATSMCVRIVVSGVNFLCFVKWSSETKNSVCNILCCSRIEKSLLAV